MTDCRHFNGYKPCGKSTDCSSACISLDVPDTRILVISLEALGAVLRSTSILPAIKRKYPKSHVTWVTKRPADGLLKENSLIDRVLTTCEDGVLSLKALQFDMAYCVDKSISAAGLLQSTKANQTFGFMVQPETGAIIPATVAANELWQIGLSDEKKFFKNKKPETQLLLEALELGPYKSDRYSIEFSKAEELEIANRRVKWLDDQKYIIGINTGCSDMIKYRKLSVDYQRRLIREIKKQKLGAVVLLGGPDDTLRNRQISAGLPITQSPTESGIRDGLLSVAACDIIISGDSLGMHMGIATQKWVIPWFGPTCAHEIELYGRGSKVVTQANCSPCWKRLCHSPQMCYDLVPLEQFIDGIKKGFNWIGPTSSYKRPSWETYY